MEDVSYLETSVGIYVVPGCRAEVTYVELWRLPCAGGALGSYAVRNYKYLLFSAVEREMAAMGGFPAASNYFVMGSCCSMPRDLAVLSVFLYLPQNSTIVDILAKTEQNTKNRTLWNKAAADKAALRCELRLPVEKPLHLCESLTRPTPLLKVFFSFF